MQMSIFEKATKSFRRFYNKYRKPILPIAIFGYKENRIESDEFSLAFPFFHVLTFNFLMIELRKMNWKNFIHSPNPVAAALLSKMGYSEKERIQVKKEFLIMLVKMKITPSKQRLIIGFFESYLKLNETEENELMEEIKTLDAEEAEEILKLPNSWMEKGKLQEKREIALKMIGEGLSTEIISKITKLSLKEIIELKDHKS